MSRRRFFTPQSTYNAFISSAEHHKQSTVLPKSQLAQTVYNNNDNTSYHTAPPLDTAIQIPLNDTNTIPLYLNRRNIDEVVRRKSLLIFINGLVGIVLMIVEQQLCWTGKKCVDNQNTMILKFCILFNSLYLVYQILDRKRVQIAIKYREKRRKNRNRHTHATEQQTTQHLLNLTQPYNVPLYHSASHVEAILNGTPKYNLLTLLSLRPTHFRWKLWTQCIVAIIHPFPYASIYLGIGDEIGLLMFLRLQLIFRVIRDYSEIWLNRRSIKKLRAFQSRTPDFNWWLSFKTVCFRSPIQFALSFAVCAVLIYGYCIYILERQAQPEQMWYMRGVWLAFQAITILWTSDVYNQFNPITWPGRLMCSLAAVNGLLLSSFIIGTVSQQLMPSRFEESALNWVVVDKIRNRERDVAARLIQFVWRNYLHEHELQHKLKHKNLRLYEEIAEKEEKEFMEEFLTRSKLLRNIRRDRAELEDQLDPTQYTAQHNIQHEQYIDEKIDTLRNDIVSTIATQDETLHRIEAMLTNLVTANKRSSVSSNVDDESGEDDNDNNTQQQSIQQQAQQNTTNEFETWLSIREREQLKQRAPFSTPLRPQISPNAPTSTTTLPSALDIAQRTTSQTPRNQRQRRSSVMSRTSRRSNDTQPKRRKNIWDYADSSLDDESDEEQHLSSTATLPAGNDSRIRSLLQRVHAQRSRSDSFDLNLTQRSQSNNPISPNSARMSLNRMFSNPSTSPNMSTVDETNESTDTHRSTPPVQHRDTNQ